MVPDATDQSADAVQGPGVLRDPPGRLIVVRLIILIALSLPCAAGIVKASNEVRAPLRAGLMRALNRFAEGPRFPVSVETP